MPFPLIKLGVLLLKQASKPVVNALKRRARKSEIVKNACMSAADKYQYFDVNIKRKMLGLKKSNRKTFVNPEEAVQFGAEVIGETFLYCFMGGLVYGEYKYLSGSSEKEKEEKQEYLNGLERCIGELELNVDRLEAENRTLQRSLGDLDTRYYKLEQKIMEKGKKS